MPDEISEFEELRQAVEKWNTRPVPITNKPGSQGCEVCGGPTEMLRCVFCEKIVCEKCFNGGQCCNRIKEINEQGPDY